MKELRLYCGRVALIDDDEYERTNRSFWTSKDQGKNNTIYAIRQFRGKPELLHRFILNCSDDMEVDHIDGNGLNCQKSNMRICTNAQNRRNSRRRVDSTYFYKGIEFDKHSNRWRASVQVDGVKYRSKRVRTEKEAAMEYNRLAIIHHGEYARLNIIVD